MGRVFDFQFDLTYTEAVDVAMDIVNLIYKNREYCAFEKPVYDIVQHCGDDLSLCFNLDNAFERIQKNFMPLAVRIEQMFELLMRDDFETDEEIYAALDKFGENYGALISFVLNFENSFKGVQHKYRF